jgi:hypothetical protein
MMMATGKKWIEFSSYSILCWIKQKQAFFRLARQWRGKVWLQA